MIAVAAFLALTATASATEPELEARAILPADATWPAPFPGVPNTDPAPAPGATQPVGGFSALLDAGNGDFWAMPDNGFGAKANSADFLLRLYHVTPDWETRRGGSGTIGVGEFISLRDPDGQVPFPIVNDATPDRLLTGADFDIESVVRARDGSLDR